ncbi:hypothetical protein [Paenibacillus beijingensis]|uniref:Uncharacterized protein n=1 Tax=Paenibacillus beijingensis TaxID=1126833 RepID=A0A0D5NH14_9BACL|nr:hypothetical protein [Paenibacillus beijingensis]AJY74430.1 hypothetical protein VN24_07375 [Paenibacillus beijingensis]
MKPKKRLFLAVHHMSNPGQPSILFVSYFFCFALFGSAAYALYTSVGHTPAKIGMELLPGILLGTGTYMPNHTLNRSAWSMIKPGFLICIAALICMFVWESSDFTVLTFAALCAGLGFAAVSHGISQEKAHFLSTECSLYNVKVLCPKLLGAIIGIAFVALFALGQWGGFLAVLIIQLFALLFLYAIAGGVLIKGASSS